MKTTLRFYFILLLVSSLSAQNIKINSVVPEQNIIGVSRQSKIKVFINKNIGEMNYNVNQLFKIYGSSSGLVSGVTEPDSVINSFTFIPDRLFFCGEIIDVSFGPLTSVGDTLRTFNWRFTTEITNPTTATFDSFSRFNNSSFSSISYDYNKDGHIDIVSGTGKVIYNDGKGNYTTSEQIPEMYDVRYLVDINNDNIVDVISAGKFSSEVATYMGTASGGYSKHQVLYPYNNNGGLIIASGDINGDGYSDLISEEFFEDFLNNEFYVIWRKYINDGTGTFVRDTLATRLEPYITKAQLTDMDNDGDLDLILLKTFDVNSNLDSTGIYIYYNDGQSIFNDRIIVQSSTTDLAQLFIIDYDKNGLNDIAVFGSVSGGVVLLQEPIGVFKEYADKTYFSSGENFAFFTSGDVNGDNRFDMVVSNYQICNECGDTAEVTFGIEINSPDLLFNYFSGKKIFELGQRKDVGVAVVPIMADVDNDGDLDIVHTGYPTTVTFNRKTSTGIGNSVELPISFELSQNYPNPFNSTTTISFRINKNCFITLKVYDILGKEVRTLLKENMIPGYYKVDFNAENLASGIYFYRINYEDKTAEKKMQLIK